MRYIEWLGELCIYLIVFLFSHFRRFGPPCFLFLVSSARPLATVLVLRVTEHSVCNTMLGAFPAYLPLLSFCDPSLLFVYFQVKNGLWYFPDYVQDLCSGPLCLLTPPFLKIKILPLSA